MKCPNCNNTDTENKFVEIKTTGFYDIRTDMGKSTPFNHFYYGNKYSSWQHTKIYLYGCPVCKTVIFNKER
jgi:hypothetical protein